MYCDSIVPSAPALRLSTANIDTGRLRDASLAEYSMLAGLQAMGIEIDLRHYFTDREINALWSARNLDQYLVRTASRYSSAPADIAAALIRDLISTTDQVIDGLWMQDSIAVGHARP